MEMRESREQQREESSREKRAEKGLTEFRPVMR
jgi:hypothetical protein